MFNEISIFILIFYFNPPLNLPPCPASILSIYLVYLQEHKTDEMHTALMEASMDGHVDVARLLLDSGAQVNWFKSFNSKLAL